MNNNKTSIAKQFKDIPRRYLDTYELTRRVLHALNQQSFNMYHLGIITSISDYKLRGYLIDFLTNELITYTQNTNTSDHRHKTCKMFHITQLGRDTLTKLNKMYSMIGEDDIPTFASRINRYYYNINNNNNDDDK